MQFIADVQFESSDLGDYTHTDTPYSYSAASVLRACAEAIGLPLDEVRARVCDGRMCAQMIVAYANASGSLRVLHSNSPDIYNYALTSSTGSTSTYPLRVWRKRKAANTDTTSGTHVTIGVQLRKP